MDGQQIHEAIIDPRKATIEVTHNGTVAQRQATSSVAAALGALVATNAGFFITSSSFGFPGVPDGIAVYNGQLESMNNGPRAALIIDHGQPQIANLEATVTVRAGHDSYPVNGINRIPGIVQDCGRPGATPTAQPRQDITCFESSELVLFTDQFGTATPSGTGSQVVLDSRGVVLSEGKQSGGAVPAGGSIIQGVGAAGTWLAAHAVPGQQLDVSERVTAGGRTIPLKAGLSIASAAPRLVTNGRTDIDAVAEGVIDPADLSFNYAWAEIRQPPDHRRDRRFRPADHRDGRRPPAWRERGPHPDRGSGPDGVARRADRDEPRRRRLHRDRRQRLAGQPHLGRHRRASRRRLRRRPAEGLVP
jgi:hypothetical protein